MLYNYHLFGFPVTSEFELPELDTPTANHKTAGPAENTVEITNGPVPRTLEDGHKVKDFLEFSRTECVYSVKDVARYLISAGRRIVIEPAPNVSMIDVRFYLFGTIIGALLHQRQLLPLHVSAVETPQGVVAFTGPSGAGKSTLANEIHRATGWRLLSDDVAVIDPSVNHTLLHCGIFRQKLWKDTAERAGLRPDMLTRDTTRAEKFHVTSPELFVSDPRHICALVVLDVGAAPRLERFGPAQAFAQIMNTIYRPDLAGLFGNRAALMNHVGQMANSIETFRFTRPWSVDGLPRSTSHLIARFSTP